MAAYVVGVLGIFRSGAWHDFARCGLDCRRRLRAESEPAVHAGNGHDGITVSGFLYLDSCLFFRVLRSCENRPGRARNSLQRCGVVAAGAMLVRYDGWVLAFAVAAGALFVLLQLNNKRLNKKRRLLWRAWGSLVVLAGLAAALWMAYNYANFIMRWPSPMVLILRAPSQSNRYRLPCQLSGAGIPRTAALYFLKVARLNLGEGGRSICCSLLAFRHAAGRVVFCAPLLSVGSALDTGTVLSVVCSMGQHSHLFS